MKAEIDHLVVAADTLERGVAHVERCLGVPCAAGGTHVTMGTHNALLRLCHNTYIEVIARNPAASSPDANTHDAGTRLGARWFGLDDARIRSALEAGPRLLTWVACTTDLDDTLARCTHEPGQPRPMQRTQLHWRIALPDDGSLIEHGLVPYLIEWPPEAKHPAEQLPDQGLRLQALHGVHPDPDRIAAALAPLGLDAVLELEPAGPGSGALLQAEIATPNGLRWLD